MARGPRSSIFWKTAWTGRQPPHTLGILCDPKHPALADFPTEFHSNWQWWYLVSKSGAMLLDELPADVKPAVQVIDDWVTARRLALLFEARVGQGRLMVSSIDLEHGLEGDPVRSQFRASVLKYMEGKRFAPRAVLRVDQVRSLFSEPSAMHQMGARLQQVSSEEAGCEGEAAIDGDARTFWHTRYRDFAPAFPHELRVELKASRRLKGFTVLPRQDKNGNGNIKDYEVYVSLDGNAWGQPVARGSFTKGDDLKRVTFGQPVEARYVRLVALSGHAQGPWAAIAELVLIPAE